MKRDYYEISDDEWPEDNSFNPSRVLKLNKPSSLPPPIESFAYSKSNNHDTSKPSNFVELVDSSSEEIGVGNVTENLEDDDAEIVSTVNQKTTSRGRRRFVVDDEDEDEDEGLNSNEDEQDIEVFEEIDAFEESEEDDDVVGKALQKCGKISTELKRELFGTAAAKFDSYAQVEEASSLRIVTQDDIDMACGEGDLEFKRILKPYQLVGVNFLLLLYRKKIGGAILADEMGLGKTIQAITYLTVLKHLEDDPGPHLIVCPASVLENWERELKRWCPKFTVIQYHGAARSTYSKNLSSLARTGLPPPFNVILVCYSLFERHSAQQKDDRKILKRWRWSCVLMDEAHALKDKSSYRWKNLMSVARNANQRLMLTGTPLQNDLHELWSILEFMMPDLFETGDVDLKKLLNAEDKELIARIKSILGPFILRRLKSDVMTQLVPKIQMVRYVGMEKDQEDAYKEAIESYRAASLARVSKQHEISTNSAAVVFSRRQISNYFLEFRKIANHPLLVRRIYTDDDIVRIARVMHPKGVFGFECTVERVIEELRSYNDFSIHKLLLYYGDNNKGVLSDEHVMVSAKCQELAKLLPSLKLRGHRVLIFSQWTSMLDILEWTLDVIGVAYRRLDGSTQVSERQTIVDTFNKDTSIFACLLSTRAGGQGLNLTGADTVIIHDMDFNPQIDRQAEDRCHRIGQNKPVTVYRLVTRNTVDENVYEIAKRKLTLDAAILESGAQIENDGDAKTMGEILSSLLLG
ncbi:protein CHROMATIN REMODELING 19 [Nicotiana sylvestris]|uniref:SWI/SNF-related matrix-associated actin-dependent regulator of chromatin subfamily A containing DEAD/H box 1 isoform X1 n=1 Tax=Nicotiana sylvestris TaxID=4096 RepID=A0A1U7YFZ0_NICSY|nr:PREDICTED: SWI/SNF-related matrix-associated actin-dependent regulator of chromatin subfamily A containing DEAD/H box 1 isoform X1 [Nicotiana sylvestris]